MRKRRERSLKELYELTQRLSEAEMTPVLNGSCRIQGPMDELDHDAQLNPGVFPSETRIGKHYLNEGLHTRAESGTCNVCAAPCSSCMHFNRDVPAMESKIESGFSDNIRKEADHCSFVNSDMSPLYKSRACGNRQHTASETSNIISASSSHDSFSENTESKSTMRTGTYDASEDVDMPPKVSSFETVREDQHQEKGHNVSTQTILLSHSHAASDLLQRSFSSLDEEQRGLECHGDNISCVTRVRDGNIAGGDLETVFDRKNMSSSSASTSGLLAKGQKKVFQVSSSNSTVEERQSNSKRPTTCTKEFLQKKTSSSFSANAEFSQKSDPSSCVPSNDDPSPKVQSSYSHCHSVDSKDLEGNSSSQLQREPSECSMEHVESSLIRPLSTTGLVEEHKYTALDPADRPPNIKDLNVSQIRSESSSGAARNSHHCLAPVSGMGNEKPPDESIKCNTLNVQFGKSSSFLEASDRLGHQAESQAIKESENSDPVIEEDDVKVCDICGDAGREDLLAICSRCSDGAEHTYCMRIMLDKVPDGDWLCEECKFKEDAENQNVDKSETISGALKGPCLNENSQNSGGTGNPKIILQLDTKPIDAEATQTSRGLLDTKPIDPEATQASRGLSDTKPIDAEATQASRGLSDTKLIHTEATQVSKVIQGSHSTTKRHSDNAEVTSTSNKKVPETSVGLAPARKTPLSRESSFKNSNVGKVKPEIMAPPFASLSANNPQVIARTVTSGLNSSRVHSLLSPRGRLSRSTSFNHFNSKSKVKQVNENIILKPNLTRDSVYSDPKKDGFSRTVSKSASFKCSSSGRSNVSDTTTKIQSLNQSWAEDTKSLKHKEKNRIERKCSFNKLDRPLNSSAIAATSSLPKAALREGKLNKLSELRMPNANRGSERAHDLVCPNEVKKQLSNSSRIPSSNGLCNSEDQKQSQVISTDGTRNNYSAIDEIYEPDTVLQHGLSQSWQSTYFDEKSKEATSVSNSLQAVSMGSRILQCQKCNETGHATQFCPIDKLRLSALKPFAISREATCKNSKWKDVVEAAISRDRGGKNNRLTGQSEELAFSQTDLSGEIASKDESSSTSSSVKNITSLVGPSIRQEKSKGSPADPSKTASVNVKEQAQCSTETLCASTDADINALGRSKVNILAQVLPDGTSVLSSPIRVSAIPKHEYIWQGCFQVQKPGLLSELCEGVQAHLSTFASPKVLEVVTKFPSKVLLEEVPRLSSWPLQFKENCPIDENIALFFFAKDFESYEKNYKKLLENLLKSDLALKGYLDGTELLIFPSNMLPVKSQRWNRLFFLWGVFRGKRLIFSEPLSDVQKKICESSVNVECSAKDLLTPLMNEDSVAQKASTFEHTDTELYGCDRSIETAPSRSTTCVDSPLPQSFESENHRFPYTNERSLEQNSSYQADADNKLPIKLQASCSFPESSLLTSMSQKIGSLDTSSESRIGTSDAKQFSQVKGISTCLKESAGKVGLTKDASYPPHIQKVGVQTNLSKNTTISTYPQSCGQADFFFNSRQRLSSDSSEVCQTSKSLLVQGMGAEGCSDKEKMKDNNERRMEGATTSISMTPEEEILSWELKKTGKKRAHSHSPEPVSRAYSETSVSENKRIPWMDKSDCISLGERKEPKRMKLFDRVHPSYSGREEIPSDRLSSKVHPMVATFMNEQLKDGVYDETTMPENSRSTERYFFPVDLGSLRDSKSGKSIPLAVISSDDEDEQESNVPNLELALGAEKRSTKQENLPLLSPLAVRKGNIDKLLDPVVEEEGDDASASLSLSLAFPFSEREGTGKQNIKTENTKTEQLLADRSRVNTSLLLFGPYPDT